MPHGGMHTLVGERGREPLQRPSGKAHCLIARAIVHRPKILLLDEANQRPGTTLTQSIVHGQPHQPAFGGVTRSRDRPNRLDGPSSRPIASTSLTEGRIVPVRARLTTQLLGRAGTLPGTWARRQISDHSPVGAFRGFDSAAGSPLAVRKEARRRGSTPRPGPGSGLSPRERSLRAWVAPGSWSCGAKGEPPLMKTFPAHPASGGPDHRS